MIVNYHGLWRCSIVNWILSVSWLAIAGVLLTALFRPISVLYRCFFPELDLSPYPVIQAVLSAPTSGLPSGWSWVLPEV